LPGNDRPRPCRITVVPWGYPPRRSVPQVPANALIMCRAVYANKHPVFNSGFPNCGSTESFMARPEEACLWWSESVCTNVSGLLAERDRSDRRAILQLLKFAGHLRRTPVKSHREGSLAFASSKPIEVFAHAPARQVCYELLGGSGLRIMSVGPSGRCGYAIEISAACVEESGTGRRRAARRSFLVATSQSSTRSALSG
jgi:hypothetical protein